MRRGVATCDLVRSDVATCDWVYIGAAMCYWCANGSSECLDNQNKETMALLQGEDAQVREERDEGPLPREVRPLWL